MLICGVRRESNVVLVPSECYEDRQVQETVTQCHLHTALISLAWDISQYAAVPSK